MPPLCTRKSLPMMTENHLIISSAERVKKPLLTCWMQSKGNRNGKTFQDSLIDVTVVFYTINQGLWKTLIPCSSSAGTHACGTATFFPEKNWIWLKPPA